MTGVVAPIADPPRAAKTPVRVLSMKCARVLSSFRRLNDMSGLWLLLLDISGGGCLQLAEPVANLRSLSNDWGGVNAVDRRLFRSYSRSSRLPPK